MSQVEYKEHGSKCPCCGEQEVRIDTKTGESTSLRKRVNNELAIDECTICNTYVKSYEINENGFNKPASLEECMNVIKADLIKSMEEKGTIPENWKEVFINKLFKHVNLDTNLDVKKIKDVVTKDAIFDRLDPFVLNTPAYNDLNLHEIKCPCCGEKGEYKQLGENYVKCELDGAYLVVGTEQAKFANIKQSVYAFTLEQGVKGSKMSKGAFINKAIYEVATRGCRSTENRVRPLFEETVNEVDNYIRERNVKITAPKTIENPLEALEKF